MILEKKWRKNNFQRSNTETKVIKTDKKRNRTSDRRIIKRLIYRRKK